MNIIGKANNGDKITACGITVTIKDIIYQDYYFDRWDNLESWDIEFHDNNGNYRHWKSYLDGGKLSHC